ncbi:hypothetical protein FNF27_08033 [Cafeteria roenbergensis]|uniref:Hexosyltransferase n=3 Tax=Cafeteria roenbergensis TaxID=33653 RepID=A0A5A8DDK0_CAFRO|nr:hypothetical protein FNF27_08033 [Cafeteria roenbergensis]
MRSVTHRVLALSALAGCLAGMPGPALARIVRYEAPTAEGDTPSVPPSEATGELARIDALIAVRRAVEDRVARSKCDLVAVPLPTPDEVLARVGRPVLPTQPACAGEACTDAVVLDDATHPFGLNVTATLPGVGTLTSARPSSQRESDQLAAHARQFGRIHFFSVSGNPTRAHRNLFRSAAFASPLLPGGHHWTVIDPDQGSFTTVSEAYACLRAGRWRKSDGSPGPDGPLSDRDLLVFLSDDVFLLPSFETALYAQLARLYASDPAWCAVGMVTTSRKIPHAGAYWGSGFTPVWGDLPADDMQVPSSHMLAMLRGSHAQFDPSLGGTGCVGADVGLSCSSSGLTSHVHPATGMATALDPWADSRGGGHGPQQPDGRPGAGGAAPLSAAELEEGRLAARQLTAKWAAVLPLEGMGTQACPLG